jgi:putative oxidoreductase
MRHAGLLVTRVVFGSYLAVHGAQKLFGSFGGHGLEATAAGFESMGMRPGKPMAALAGASELGGGILTATGIAEPLGPLAIAGTMVVASAVHRKQGPLSQNGGFELPLTNFALAIALLSSGSGRLRLGPSLPKSLTRIALIGGAGLAAFSLAKLLSAPVPAPVAVEARVDAEGSAADDRGPS